MIQLSLPATCEQNFPIGVPRLRVEDERLVRGRGRFVDDVDTDECLYLEFVRSQSSSARLIKLDVETARASEGVVAVITGVDVAVLGELSINPLIDGMQAPKSGLLARDHIHAVGQPLAAVIAKTRMQAIDAAQLVSWEYEIDEDRASKNAFRQAWRAGDCEAEFARAAHTLHVKVEHSRLAPMALEPRATVAEVDATGCLTAWISTQTPHRARDELARILSIEKSRIRVIAPDVGGSFGGKASIYPEDVVVAFAALRIGSTVKWCATRSEDFLSATQGRGGLLEGWLAVSDDGRFTALRAEAAFPLGYWLPYSAQVPARNAGRILPGPYLIQNVDISVRGDVTADAPVNIYRGAGRPEATMLMERLADAAARATGMDPVDIRFKNLIAARQLPYQTPTGERLDAGDYPALLTTVCAMSNYVRLRKGESRRKRDSKLRGQGIAVYVEPCGAGWESAFVGLDHLGRIVAGTGSTSQGQGRETAAAQIVAAALGVAPEQVVIHHGDTASAPDGIGALASRSTAIGGSALLEAARKFEERARSAAAHLLQASIERIERHSSGFQVQRDGEQLVCWRDIALAEAGEGSCGLCLKTDVRYDANEAWASGAVLATIAIDEQTGELEVEKIVWVDDAGTVVNPMLVNGQLVGGLAQGLGEALVERIVYDDSGQLVTGSLMDYGVLRANDMPMIEIKSQPTRSVMNALGAKGAGEAGCIGVPAAVVNAVIDALSPFGIEHLDMPLTSDRIWTAIRDVKLKRDRTP